MPWLGGRGPEGQKTIARGLWESLLVRRYRSLCGGGELGRPVTLIVQPPPPKEQKGFPVAEAPSGRTAWIVLVSLPNYTLKFLDLTEECRNHYRNCNGQLNSGEAPPPPLHGGDYESPFPFQ